MTRNAIMNTCLLIYFISLFTLSYLRDIGYDNSMLSLIWIVVTVMGISYLSEYLNDKYKND